MKMSKSQFIKVKIVQTDKSKTTNIYNKNKLNSLYKIGQRLQFHHKWIDKITWVITPKKIRFN